MLPRSLARLTAAQGVARSAALLAPAAGRASQASAGAVSARFASAWLQGKPPTVNVDAGTLAAFYYKHVRQFETPTKDFVLAYGQDEKFTVEQFDKQVYGYAVGILEGLGVKKGTKVATWMTSELEHLVIQLAAGLIGAEVVVLDPALNFDAVLKVLGTESVRVLFMSPRVGAENRAAKLHEVFAEELDVFNYEWGYEPYNSKRFRSFKYIVQSGSEEVDGVVNLSDLPVYGTGGEHDHDDVAAVQSYLSKSDAVVTPYGLGSDGDASVPVKGKPATHADVLGVAATAARALGLNPADVVVVTAPLHTQFAVAAGALAAASANAKTVVPSKTFDAAKTLKAITQQRATVLVATPDQVASLADALALDAAKGAKAEFSIDSLRGGLLLAPSGKTASLGKATLKAL
jgi:acyl-CoA synthetase (AMP-forming)/AMP-acid ligase II